MNNQMISKANITINQEIRNQFREQHKQWKPEFCDMVSDIMFFEGLGKAAAFCKGWKIVEMVKRITFNPDVLDGSGYMGVDDVLSGMFSTVSKSIKSEYTRIAEWCTDDDGKALPEYAQFSVSNLARMLPLGKDTMRAKVMNKTFTPDMSQAMIKKALATEKNIKAIEDKARAEEEKAMEIATTDEEVAKAITVNRYEVGTVRPINENDLTEYTWSMIEEGDTIHTVGVGYEMCARDFLNEYINASQMCIISVVKEGVVMVTVFEPAPKTFTVSMGTLADMGFSFDM